VKTKHQEESERIVLRTAEFLKRGGQINRVPQGVSAETDQCDFQINPRAAYQVAKQKAKVKK